MVDSSSSNPFPLVPQASLGAWPPVCCFSNTTVQKHQFFGPQPSSQFNSHIHTGVAVTVDLENSSHLEYPSNRPATPLFSPACWELGFQGENQAPCAPMLGV